MTAIQCNNLCKTFLQGEQSVIGLDQVSLVIQPGDFICLSGPSGSGKTTLLNALGGLATPDSGEIRIDNKDIVTLNKGELADLRLHKLGFVFQAYNLIPVLTAQENVEFVMQLQGVSHQQRGKKAAKVLEEVGLSGLQNRLPAQLSGGQQQRVAVARAIVSEPRLLLADEPTANLDSVSATQLMELLTDLNQQHKTTCVIATHDERVMRYARRLIRMEDGKILSDTVQKG